ncbi:MAG TPA: ATP-binding protein [Candidatus Dormibacteraeota bacterium]
MARFIGRDHELRKLHEILDEVRQTGSGRLLAIRGRRRVGKSRLVEEWLQREGLPHVFYEAARQPASDELASFATEIAESNVQAASLVRSGLTFQSWDAALRVIASQATSEAPAVVVIDEFPYLFEGDPHVDAAIQRAWDREIDHRAPVLLVLIGSDITMMERLTEYGRPLYGRAREMVVRPLSPAETAEMLGRPADEALDAYTVLGGYPALVESWRGGDTLWAFLERDLEPTSPLLVNAERMLSSEFPSELSARRVLEAIGSGEPSYSTIADLAAVPQTTLNRALEVLTVQKRVVSVMQPLSTRPPSRLRRYLVADPYLRFWLRFLGPSLPEIERGRTDLVLDRIRSGWTTYQGTAIEPVVREAVTRILPDERFGDARFCGAYWTRTGEVEVDLVGADEEPVAKRIAFVGSIKWRERQPFDRRDLADLAAQRSRVPGAMADARLVAVTRAGATANGLDVTLGPEDLLAAYRRRT